MLLAIDTSFDSGYKLRMKLIERLNTDHILQSFIYYFEPYDNDNKNEEWEVQYVERTSETNCKSREYMKCKRKSCQWTSNRESFLTTNLIVHP